MTGKSMIAYCGITCSECTAFEATRDRDQEKLAETAAKWSTSEMKFEPEDILCDGCLSDRVFKWSIECPTGRCGMERGVDNCGPCRDYPLSDGSEITGPNSGMSAQDANLRWIRLRQI